MMSTTLLLTVLATLIATTFGQTDAEKCSKLCQFTPDEDRGACWVLGQVPTNLGTELIYWKGASQTCLDAIKIAANALPLSQLKSIWPTIDGANANANAYVSFLKNGDNTVTKGLKIGWPDFFSDDGTLKNSITVNGTVTDCKTDSAGCYNQFKAFIQVDAAAKKHVAEDGVTLWKTFRKDRELEQATARINICAAAIGSEKDDADRKAQIASCTEVKDQIVALSTGLLKDAKVAGTGAIQCSSYGIGPGTRTCDGSSSGTTGSGVVGETTTAGSNAASGNTTVSNDRGLGGSAATIGMASLAILVALAAQL